MSAAVTIQRCPRVGDVFEHVREGRQMSEGLYRVIASADVGDETGLVAVRADGQAWLGAVWSWETGTWSGGWSTQRSAERAMAEHERWVRAAKWRANA